MNWTQLFDELCKDLEHKLNTISIEPEKPVYKRTVELKSLHYPSDGGFVFELRLEIEKTCTFRETHYYQPPINRKEIEDKAYMRLLKATFCYGVDIAKKLIDQRFTDNK